MKKVISALFFLSTALVSFAQSKSFKMGQWVEINNAIVKKLNQLYVDTLQVERIQKAGIDAMLAAIDPYTVYLPAEEEDVVRMMLQNSYGGIGAIIYKPRKEGYLVINEPYKNSPADKAGLKCGDQVMEIDGVTTEGLTAQECTNKMKGEPGTKFKMKIKKVRTGKIEEKEFTREIIHFPNVEYYGMLTKTVGYIQQSGFTENVSEEIKEAVIELKKKGMKTLIYDLRGNGGGLFQEAVKIVSLFVPEGSLVASQIGKDKHKIEYRTQTEPIDTELPIVVLVDGSSASASEIVSGALQDMDRAQIFGTRTFGKGLVQSMESLPYGGYLKVTTAKYYTPSGRCVQALDYSKRNEDGSVKSIPDSLTKEFKTLKGRIVRDGGGITPDVTFATDTLNRLVYGLLYGGLLSDYPIEYCKKHESIDSTDNFRLSDEDFEDFVNYAKSQNYDSRSSANAIFDALKSTLKSEKLYDDVKEHMDGIKAVINMDKEKTLRRYKKDYIHLLEKEIVARYYFKSASVRYMLQFDKQLKQTLEKINGK